MNNRFYTYPSFRIANNCDVLQQTICNCVINICRWYPSHTSLFGVLLRSQNDSQ